MEELTPVPEDCRCHLPAYLLSTGMVRSKYRLKAAVQAERKAKGLRKARLMPCWCIRWHRCKNR